MPHTRHLLPTAALALLSLAPTFSLAQTQHSALSTQHSPPNFVLIFCDDLGYADIGCFGAEGYATPNIDRLAKEGVRLTDFYVAASVCSPSRAALLTGCYPQRVGVTKVLFPTDKTGLNPAETTLPELLKTKGYATAAIGKWHLGCLPPLLPTNHGFDSYFGLPYSNDMSPAPHTRIPTRPSDPPLPLYRNDQIIEREPDQRNLTRRYTEEAIKFIETSKAQDKPFFLYLPHTMPHVPLYASDTFAGKTKRGLYGDVIEELDWSVGQVLSTLDRHGLSDNTLVIFTSDNGPWLAKRTDAGSAKPLRLGKGTPFEGGFRVPFVARYPGRVPPGHVSHEPAAAIDLLPTFAKLAGADLPANRIDGQDITALLTTKDAKSPHEAIYFATNTDIRAVRAGKWKLHVAAQGSRKLEPHLYDLETDVAESTNVADEHPDVVARLTALLDRHRADVGDTLTNTQGSSTRPAGRAD